MAAHNYLLSRKKELERKIKKLTEWLNNHKPADHKSGTWHRVWKDRQEAKVELDEINTKLKV